MWAVVPAILNPLLLVNCTCIASKMAGKPSFQRYTSTQEILRSIANLPDEHVEEVFQGTARMPQISSVVLDHMAGLLSDMFEDSRDVLLPSRGGRAPNRKASTSQYEPPPRGRVTRSITKAGNDGPSMEGGVEEDVNKKAECEEERTSSPIQEPITKVNITLIFWTMSLRLVIHCKYMTNGSQVFVNRPGISHCHQHFN